MLGDNPVRHALHHPAGALMVQEVFSTIQGEGLRAGTPAVFVRLAGCNLRCWFCDTDFEEPYREGKGPVDPALVARRVQEVADPGCRLVVLTGGEPMLQNIWPLIHVLVDWGYDVEIETAGTVQPPHFDFISAACRITVSPKTPHVNPQIAKAAACWKYIIEHDAVDPEDALPVMSSQLRGRTSRLARYYDYSSAAPVYVQPLDNEKLEDNTREAVRSAMRFGYTVSVQIHKLLNLP